MDGVGHEVGKALPDRPEGEKEHERQNAREDGKGGIAPEQHGVHLAGAELLARDLRLDDRRLADALNIGIAHVRHGGLAVQPAFLFHLMHDVPDDVLFVFVEAQRGHRRFVALHQLGGGKARRHAGGGRVVLHQVRKRVDRLMHRAGAEVQPLGSLLFARGLLDRADDLLRAFVFDGGDGDAGDAERVRKAGDIDRAVVGAHLVHHVERDDHGDAKLQKLQRQVQVALDVGGVHDIDDAVRLFLEQEVA